MEPQSRSQLCGRGLWGVLRGKRNEKKCLGEKGEERRPESRLRDKGGRALCGKAESQSWRGSSCKRDFRRLQTLPSPIHFQLVFLLAPLLHPSCQPLPSPPRADEAAGRLRGLDSAHQEVRRGGRKLSSKQNRTQGSMPPSEAPPHQQWKELQEWNTNNSN